MRKEEQNFDQTFRFRMVKVGKVQKISFEWKYAVRAAIVPRQYLLFMIAGEQFGGRPKLHSQRRTE